MKLTHLDMVQNILSRLDGDEVNSYSDTTESKQVSEILRTTYFNIITRANLPEHSQTFQLTPSGDADYPTIMYRPDNVAKIEWIKYDIDDGTASFDGPAYEYVTILPYQQFLTMINKFDPGEDNVGSFILNDITYYFKNDLRPCYCTILNDSILIFDSYNTDVDSTLQNSKTLCYGRIIPTYTLDDDFIPDLDDQQFPLLLNEATAVAFVDLKQAQNPKAEQEARRQWRTLQRDKRLAEKLSSFDQLPDFGRRGGWW